MRNFWSCMNFNSIKSVVYIVLLYLVRMLKAQNLTTLPPNSETLLKILDYDKNISGINNESHVENSEGEEIIPLWRLLLDYR